MNKGIVNLLVRWSVLAIGVVLSTKLVSGISYDDGSTLLLVVLLLSFFNAVLRPLLLLFTLPFIVLTLGVGVWLINAGLFYFVGRLVEGFHVADFWAALWGALILSLTNMIMTAMLAPKRLPSGSPPPPARPPAKPDDVIDI